MKQVGEGEKFLRALGFSQLRVRHHGPVARIEVEPEAIADVLARDTRDKNTRKFESLGYTYVSLDLKGYRTGSMNEVIISNDSNL